MHPLSTLVLLGAAASLPAQNFDLIGATFQGQILRIDSATGATQALGTMPVGANAMAMTADDRIWTTERTGTSGAFHFHLAVIDPLTGVATLPFGALDVGDLRGLTAKHDGNLYAVRDGTPSDELVEIDTTTGAVTAIGPMGFTGIQALDDTVLGLMAWDINAGLLTVQPLTGVATDPFPGVGSPATLQWLATDPVTGTLLVGRTTLQVVDLQTGLVGPAIAISGAPDLRGVEFTTARLSAFGVGCGTVPRLAGDLVVAGSTQVLTTRNGFFAPGTLGVQVIGLSNTTHHGLALPQPLDPLLGTSGCHLNVSIDITQFGFADGTGLLRIPLTLPASLTWFTLFAQHAAFVPGLPGGMSTSQGLRARTHL